jgi:hypothetical protein
MPARFARVSTCERAVRRTFRSTVHLQLYLKWFTLTTEKWPSTTQNGPHQVFNWIVRPHVFLFPIIRFSVSERDLSATLRSARSVKCRTKDSWKRRARCSRERPTRQPGLRHGTSLVSCSSGIAKQGDSPPGDIWFHRERAGNANR